MHSVHWLVFDSKLNWVDVLSNDRAIFRLCHDDCALFNARSSRWVSVFRLARCDCIYWICSTWSLGNSKFNGKSIFNRVSYSGFYFLSREKWRTVIQWLKLLYTFRRKNTKCSKNGKVRRDFVTFLPRRKRREMEIERNCENGEVSR